MEWPPLVEKLCMMLMLSMGAGCFVEKREIAGQAGNDERPGNDEKGLAMTKGPITIGHIIPK